MSLRPASFGLFEILSPHPRTSFAVCVCAASLAGAFAFISAPASYFLYILFPPLLLGNILSLYRCEERGEGEGEVGGGRERGESTGANVGAVLMTVALSLLSLECVYFSFTHRESLSLSLLFLSAAYLPRREEGRERERAGEDTWARSIAGPRFLFPLSSLALSVFLFLPTDAGELPYLAVGGGAVPIFLWIWIGCQRKDDTLCSSSSSSFFPSSYFRYLFLLLFLLSLLCSLLCSLFLSMRLPIPSLVHSLSWCLLLLSPSVLFFYMRKRATPWESLAKHDSRSIGGSSQVDPFMVMRPIFYCYLSSCGVYSLLSISYEVLFFSFLFVALILWICVEIEDVTSSENSPHLLSSVDSFFFGHTSLFRRCVAYLVFTHISFFGTGNFASLSSFDLSSTYRFLSVFDPFTMAALLLLKVLLPFFLLVVAFVFLHSYTFSPLTKDLSRPASDADRGLVLRRCLQSMIAVSGVADILSVHFFFSVKNEGSWFQIGQSISHFAMTNGNIVFQLFAFSVASFLLKRVTSAKYEEKKEE